MQKGKTKTATRPQPEPPASYWKGKYIRSMEEVVLLKEFVLAVHRSLATYKDQAKKKK